MNAYKHGMRAKKQELLRGDSIAFENRLHKWMAIEDPHNDIGEFIVYQNVSVACEVERARQAHLEGLASLIETSDDTEIEEVYELGKRLFFDPSGPAQLYGNAGVPRRGLRTSWNGLAVDPNDPAALVRKLESTEPGCLFLRGCWEDLRAKLEPPSKFWQSHDRLTATRLLGCQPLDLIADRRVAEIFVASHALNPIGKTPFDDLQSDITTTSGLDGFRKDVKARWPDLVSTEDKAQCRQILIDLVDWHIEQLNSNLAEHAAHADANAQRTITRLSVDKSPDAQRLRAYHLKCLSAFARGLDTLRKYQGKKKAEGRKRKDEYAGMMEKDGGRRIPDFARWAPGADASDHVPDRSIVGGDGERDSFEPSMDWDALHDGEPQADCGNGNAGATECAGATMVTDTTLSDGVTLSESTSASASVTLSVGITLLEGSELEAGAGDHVGQIGNPSLVAFTDLFPRGSSPEVSDADAVPDRGDAMSQRTEKSQNVTNEAKFAETATIIQDKYPVEVTANCGADRGLDSGPESLEVARGKQELNADILASPPGAAELLRPHLPRSP